VRRFELPRYIACWRIFSGFHCVESGQSAYFNGKRLAGSSEADIFRATEAALPCGRNWLNDTLNELWNSFCFSKHRRGAGCWHGLIDHCLIDHCLIDITEWSPKTLPKDDFLNLKFDGIIDDRKK